MKYKLFSLRELLLSSSKNQIKKILKTFKCEKFYEEDNSFMAIENLSNDKEVIKMIYWLID